VYWKTSLALMVLGLVVLGVVFGVGLATYRAEVEWPLILRVPMVAILVIAGILFFLGLWGLLLAVSPKLRRHIEELESQPKQKRWLRRDIEARDNKRRARKR
jgi:high-affinity Fe2+/Pb2+ permease